MDDFLNVELYSEYHSSVRLSWQNAFFQRLEKYWLQPQSLELGPIKHWQVDSDYRHCVVDSKLPIIFGSHQITGT